MIVFASQVRAAPARFEAAPATKQRKRSPVARPELPVVVRNPGMDSEMGREEEQGK